MTRKFTKFIYRDIIWTDLNGNQVPYDDNLPWAYNPLTREHRRIQRIGSHNFLTERFGGGKFICRDFVVVS
jgi:hypothetical protein